MAILRFLVTNWDSCVVVIGVVAAVIILVKKGETKILEQIVFGFVTNAEKELGSGTGKLKYSVVADWLYQRIPSYLKFIFTSKDIEKLIERVLKQAQESWANNKKLLETPPVATAMAEPTTPTAD